jgi:hypothetical protein
MGLDTGVRRDGAKIPIMQLLYPEGSNWIIKVSL